MELLEWVAMDTRVIQHMIMVPKVVEVGMVAVVLHIVVLPAVAPAIISKTQ